jgi:formylglycine-generating enzyme
MAFDPRPSYFVAALVLLVTGVLTACRSSEASSTEGEGAPSVPESMPVADAEADVEAQAVVDASAEAGVVPASVAVAAADAGADADADGGTPPDCPPEMHKIGRYCVDRWEAHLATTGADGSIMPWPHYDRPEKGPVYMARSAAGVFPQAYISRVEAKEACTNAGKRLCSRTEWVRACKGEGGTRYPYGNKGKSGACNTGKPHLLEKFHGASRRSWTYEIFNDPKLDREPGFLAKSGDYEVCQSDEGVFDIVGNLHEWVSDTVDSDIEEVMAKDEVERKTQPWKVGNAMFLGGFFSTTIEHGPGCMYMTIAHEPTYHDYSTGFRCCKDVPAPARTAKGKRKKPD